MNRKNNHVNLTIDNKAYQVESSISILKAAEQNDIYIPTLCAHKELSPYGGCRLCIVEVEGARNFPTACTTPVQEGMVIRTHTAQVQAVRKEILQLFLSEHPASCLVCQEQEECEQYSITIRKAGVTTGCRYCSKDGQCELQEVARRLGVDEIKYPIYYRNQRVEKEDPFYDRDYNLCILCGRCIRMCQEVRVANVLAFKQRGRSTVIGPAFDRTHFEAGCEFCGACVSVCPTGALIEKTKAWDMKPDREEVTTCSFCGVGCQLRLLVKDDRIIGSLPYDDPLVNNSQLCVKGRFCITELVNSHKRLKRPYMSYNGIQAEITWGNAVEMAAEKLSACPPESFAMLVSPNCTNEDLYVAQKFARFAMRSHHIDTSARFFYGAGFNAYLRLMKKSAPLSALRKAPVILCIGLDTRFGRSVIGVELRRAVQRGAKIVTVHPHRHNLSLISHKWLRPDFGDEADLLLRLTEIAGGNLKAISSQKGKGNVHPKALMDDVSEAGELLGKADEPVILIGSEFLQYNHSRDILEAVEELAEKIHAGVFPLPAQNNLFGSILMGAYSELLPGGFSSSDKRRRQELGKKWGTKIPEFIPEEIITPLSNGRKLKVLYLMGEFPPAGYPPADYLISQNIFPLDGSWKADLALPAAAFTESDGTFINGEGRVQRVRKAVSPPGAALPDWQILCRIAKKMGISGFDFRNVAEIHREISQVVPGFANFEKPGRNPAPLNCEGEFFIPENAFPKSKRTDKKFPFILRTFIPEHTHRGYSLSSRVDGARKLFPEEIVAISPQDAHKKRISEGERVVVKSAKFEKDWLATISEEQAPGTLQITLPPGESVGRNPHPVNIRKKNV